REAAPTANAAPNPVEAPVTTTILPSKSRMQAAPSSRVGCQRCSARATGVAGNAMSTDPKGLSQLGHTAPVPANPDAAKLERVSNPHIGSLYLVRFSAPEFTSICPVTGQPDFGILVIDYAPKDWIVESKSLKLFLQSFRNHGAFHEDCTPSVANPLIHPIGPTWLRVGGYWNPRGGMPIDVFWQTGAAPEGLWLPDQGVASYKGRG